MVAQEVDANSQRSQRYILAFPCFKSCTWLGNGSPELVLAGGCQLLPFVKTSQVATGFGVTGTAQLGS